VLQAVNTPATSSAVTINQLVRANFAGDPNLV
jgi:hypothetical protein